MFDTDTTGFSEPQWMEVRRRMGMLFQESALFDSLNIEENVSYPLVNQPSPPPTDEVECRVLESLRFVELEHTVSKFPSELSGGMRRRVGIARAIVTDPPLVLYDSPTAGLDPITANTIMAVVAKERDTKDTTTAIVTHRFQDGELMAKFRYNPDRGKLEPVERNGTDADVRTIFMVLKEGELVFEGHAVGTRAVRGSLCLEIRETLRERTMPSAQKVSWAKLRVGITAIVALSLIGFLVFPDDRGRKISSSPRCPCLPSSTTRPRWKWAPPCA